MKPAFLFASFTRFCFLRTGNPIPVNAMWDALRSSLQLFGTVFSANKNQSQHIFAMEPLFEAKALYENEYALYNVFRLEAEKYKAELISDKDGSYDAAAPMELIVMKKKGEWHTEDVAFSELGSTIGIEIDAFNNGYGALLGRIGIA